MASKEAHVEQNLEQRRKIAGRQQLCWKETKRNKNKGKTEWAAAASAGKKQKNKGKTR